MLIKTWRHGGDHLNENPLLESVWKPKFQTIKNALGEVMSPNVSESFFGESTARRGFEIFFKIESFLPVSKSNCRFYTPGFVL